MKFTKGILAEGLGKEFVRPGGLGQVKVYGGSEMEQALLALVGKWLGIPGSSGFGGAFLGAS